MHTVSKRTLTTVHRLSLSWRHISLSRENQANLPKMNTTLENLLLVSKLECLLITNGIIMSLIEANTLLAYPNLKL
jgi:hypothetical protein